MTTMRSTHAAAPTAATSHGTIFRITAHSYHFTAADVSTHQLGMRCDTPQASTHLKLSRDSSGIQRARGFLLPKPLNCARYHGYNVADLGRSVD